MVIEPFFLFLQLSSNPGSVTGKEVSLFRAYVRIVSLLVDD